MPIECKDISENVLKLPRNPDKAHLVPVQLKRRLEYKSTHLEQFIRPQLCLDALKYLKENNKFYEEIEIEENFMDNIEEGEDVESEIESQAKEREEEEMEPSDAMEKDNVDSQNDDDENSTILKSVRENQSKQDGTTFLLPDDMANQIIANHQSSTKHQRIGDSNSSVKIAPGEGKIPTNLMREENFDVKGFPKHYPTGRFGLHHTRKHKLSAQMYFNQRLLNQDERFSRDPCFVFLASYYIERRSIEQQINISGELFFISFNGKIFLYLFLQE